MHRVLERQIKRFVGELNNVPPSLAPLFRAISDTYVHFDEDRTLSIRSLELSSKELLEYNQRLQEAREKVESVVEERTRELWYEKAKLDSVAQNTIVATFLLNGTGEVVFINRAAKKMLGSEMDEKQILALLERKFSSIRLPEHITRCLTSRESYSIPEIDADNKVYEILFRCLETADIMKKYSAGLLIMVRDITDEKLLDRSKNEFILIASHEMRTPLTIIRGNAELLSDFLKVSPLPFEQIQTMISSIYRSCERLLKIVNEFLDLTRLEGGRIELKKEKFNIVPLIRSAMFEFKKAADEKNLSLTLELPAHELPAVLADRNYSQHIIINLISNAIHYTQEGGITIGIQQEEQFIKVFVSDTGIGIEKDKQGLLFQKFSSVGKSFTHTKEYGSGLGLYIGKLLVEPMGGKITLEKSVVGEGSVFSVSLPIAT